MEKIKKRDELYKLLESIKDPSNKGVEVGTFKGEFSKIILDTWEGNLFMVDVWRPLPNDEYDDQSNHNNHFDAYLDSMNNTTIHSERAHMLRCRSSVACEFFPDNSLDFVYIDANHTYESVTEDIHLWYTKVKSGGVLAGHDYLSPSFYPDGSKDIPLILWNEQTPDIRNYAGMFGVNPAVNEFCQKEGYEINVTDEFLGTWWITKK